MTILSWAPEDRPREKLMSKGRQALSIAELLAILIGSGNRNETAVELAQRILNGSNNNLRTLSRLGVKELISSFGGIGEAKAVSIIAALELGLRRMGEELPEKKRLLTSSDTYRFFYPYMIDLPHEEFWILLLNSSNKVIDQIKIGQGGVSSTAVDVKLILKPAIMQLAPAIVLCHNHPSNSKAPSQQDEELTRKICEGAAMFDIRIPDHIIFCEDGFYSFADENKL